MALHPEIRDHLSLPVICAPMFLVTGPDLVSAACKAGIMGVLPRQNARTFETFETWLAQIRSDLDRAAEENPGAKIGPLAVNLATRMDPEDLTAHLDVCRRYGVDIVVSAQGDPSELVRRVHDWGGLVFHDVTSLRFAEKAIAAGVDGMNCIGAGGGGHSGTISHLVLIPKIRSMFDGMIVMAGAVTNGAAVRAAEILGSDLAYMGTRFIATRESMASDEYKEMIVRDSSSDLVYTGEVAGVPANWMVNSMRQLGLEPGTLPAPTGSKMRYGHLPSHVKPWKNLWSAGQGIDLIDDVPSVAELVGRLHDEYAQACAIPSFAANYDLDAV
jgi:nitronate monooxygenase